MHGVILCMLATLAGAQCNCALNSPMPEHGGLPRGAVKNLPTDVVVGKYFLSENSLVGDAGLEPTTSCSHPAPELHFVRGRP